MNKRNRKQLKDMLDKTSNYYVLITCSEPTEDGQIEVEMTYQGDAALASYLIQGAQGFLDQEENDFQTKAIIESFQ